MGAFGWRVKSLQILCRSTVSAENMLPGAYLNPVFHLNLTKPAKRIANKKKGLNWPHERRTPMGFNDASAERSGLFGFLLARSPQHLRLSRRRRCSAARSPLGKSGFLLFPGCALLFFCFGCSCATQGEEKSDAEAEAYK